MRLWMDDQDRMLTDEQLLRQIAHYGSLKESLDHSNVRLIAGSEHTTAAPRNTADTPQRSLRDYL